MNMHDINPIGTIYSPFNTIEDMPIQPKGAVSVEGYILLHEKFMDGLKDLEGFSHIYLLYSFHKAVRTELVVKPFMDKAFRGVFSTRSPLRPNHIGLSIVRLKKIEKNKLIIQDVDILNQTPLLDIKPYIREFDQIKESRSGWLKAGEEEIKNKRSDKRFK